MVDKNLFLIDLSESQSLRCWGLEFDDLTFPEQVFRAIWELESDVNNGGFDQYYFNSSGDTAFMAEDALTEIGANKCADIVRRANAVFEDGHPPQDRTLRQKILVAISDESKELLNSLDQEFYAYPDNVTDLLYDYVIANSDQIQGQI